MFCVLLRSWRMAAMILTAIAHRFGKSLEVSSMSSKGEGCFSCCSFGNGMLVKMEWKSGVVDGVIWFGPTTNRLLSEVLKPKGAKWHLSDLIWNSIPFRKELSKELQFFPHGTSTLMELPWSPRPGGDKGGVWHLRFGNGAVSMASYLAMGGMESTSSIKIPSLNLDGSFFVA